MRNTTVVADGLALDVAETGPQDGRPIVLIPGLSDSWRSYLPLIAEMPGRFRLIAVSLRGHGDSAKPGRDYTLPDLARDIAAVMDAHGVARADVVGHSLGSTVAQKLAELAPERVASLTLIGPFVRMGANPGVIGFRDEVITPMTDPVDPDFVREFQESAVGPDTPRSTIDAAVAESLKLTARDWKAALQAGMETDLTDALAGYRGPVLVLHGKADGFCLEEEQAELSRGENRRLVSQQHWGHSPHWERPAEVAQILADFLAPATGAVS